VPVERDPTQVGMAILHQSAPTVVAGLVGSAEQRPPAESGEMSGSTAGPEGAFAVGADGTQFDAVETI
jgi:hypothetical protein